MKSYSFYLVLFTFFVFTAFAQDKGIPPVVKITPTPIPTSSPIPKHTKHSYQEILRTHTNPTTTQVIKPQIDKKKILEFDEKLKKLTKDMQTRSEACSIKSNTLKIHLDEFDYMSSHHRLFILFGNIDPNLPPPPATCQVCLDANQEIKNYFSCLLTDDNQSENKIQLMIGTDFKNITKDEFFYDYMKFKYGSEVITKMKHFYQYLNEQIK